MDGEIKLAKGEHLLREGDDSDELYFLQEGFLAITKGRGEAEREIGAIGPGDVVGEMSFLDEEPRCASVKAKTACRLTAVPRREFAREMDALPPWYKSLVRTLLERLRKAGDRIRI